MERFKNILFVSLGGKEDSAALDRANRLAVTNRSRVTLIRVVEELPASVALILPQKKISELKEASLSLATTELEKLLGKVDPSVKVEIKVVFGKPFIELIRAVQLNSYDLIIKPTSLSSGDNSLESTDLHLLRKCPCPVWIIKPNQRKPFAKILIAVDPDPSEPDRLQLDKELMKLGTSLAERENGKVEVVHTWLLDGESMLRSPRFSTGEKEIQQLADNVKAVRQGWLDDLLASYQHLPIKVSLLKGTPGPTLVELIEKRKPDIVVMGTVARTGLPGLLIGNTAEFVLSRISCSVMTLKPKGFITPVS